jgi:predicted transcriptional regulator
MKVIKVPMEEDLLQRLSRQAKARRLTRAALIREA